MAEADIRRIARGLNNLIERTVRGIAADATRNLAEGTPKRTGFAAASWIPTTGGTDHLQIEPQGDVGRQRSEQESAVQELAGYTLKDGIIYIVNTSGRAAELDAGSSSQAPSGFVEAAVEKTIRDRAR